MIPGAEQGKYQTFLKRRLQEPPLQRKTTSLPDSTGYYKAYQPKEYIFEGQNKDQPYSTHSIPAILQKAKKAAGSDDG
jgi:hypothetical protein